MKLSGPDYFEWLGLRRVRRGGLARREATYYDRGNPIASWPIPDILDDLLQDGLLELSEPESGMQQVTLTDAGLAHYRTLCTRQRQGPGGAVPAALPLIGDVRHPQLRPPELCVNGKSQSR